MKWFIGCSGFNYREWRGNFYPTEVKVADWLSYYATIFNSVELNGTFYKFPELKNLQRFYKITPADFSFSVKAHKIITHTMRMNAAKNKIAEYRHIVEDGLQEKLHCILFQLPGNFKYSEENLDHILNSLVPQPSSVVEFRDLSWWRTDVFKALKKHRLTFCNVSFPGLSEERHFTTTRFYMRFHGVPKLFYSSYTQTQLKKVIEEVSPGIKECYVYFNNTVQGNAYKNAALFQQLVAEKQHEKSRKLKKASAFTE